MSATQSRLYPKFLSIFFLLLWLQLLLLFLCCLSQLSCTFMVGRLINNLCQIIPLCHNKLKLATYFPGVCDFSFFIMAKSVSLVAHLENGEN